MDKKGYIIGVIAKTRVIMSCHEKRSFITQYCNREWVSLIECVSLDGQKLRLWVIFQGKKQKKA